MLIKEYEIRAMLTNKVNPDRDKELAQKTLGLAGESGEVSEIVKKHFRGDYNLWNNPKMIEKLAYEISDILWYVTALAKHLGYSLEDIAKMNNAKLLDRLRRNKIQGDGDNR